MWTLGINWRWHDTAAALVDGDGLITALFEEERLTRNKHAWDSLPINAVRKCLATANISWKDLDVVALGWDLRRIRTWTSTDSSELYVQLFGPTAATARRPELVFVEHHLAHALSAFHASGFEDAGVLVVDGSGELEAMSIYSASRASGLTLKRRWPRVCSLGTMYNAATRAIGLGPLSEGKTMGLAPYGTISDSDMFPIGDLMGDGGGGPLQVPEDASYSDYTEAWMRYLGRRFPPICRPAHDLDKDPIALRIAASAQRTVEEALRAMHAETVCLTGSQSVCLTGGVALNSVANGLLPEPIFVPPFPHDGGVALGAAWYVCPPTERAPSVSPYLGTELDTSGSLETDGLRVQDMSVERVLELMLSGGIGAIAEGRAEVGPRALGHRSIIALPAPADMRDKINKIKGREPWRPLGPVTLPHYASRLWPADGLRERYMAGTTLVSGHGRVIMPAAVHVDGTSRPQVLQSGQGHMLERILEALESDGHPPVVINTSFNGPDEPIVDSATDAIECFRRLRLDFLILGDRLVQSR